MARGRIAELEHKGVQVELHQIGRKGIGYFRYTGRKMARAIDNISDRPTMADAEGLIDSLMGRFASGELDAVELIFAQFVSAMSTPPATLRILPVDVTRVQAGSADKGGSATNYILRPSADEIVGAILPLYVRNQMYRALVETAAAEQGARRTAMKNATDNAGEMLDKLRRTYNRARQAQITQEIAEVVGGAEAL
jgi:F-type H+-transporting ATPase subunit gamma